MSTRDIHDQIKDLYGIEISAEHVSHITDRVIEHAKMWKNRPLDTVYPFVFMDAIHYKVRDESKIKNKVSYVILGVNKDGFKDILGIWIGENDNWSDWNDLADYTQQIIDSCGKNKDRYIVMGLTAGSNEGMAEYDSIMSERFGSHFLNVRKYLSEYNLYKTTVDYTDNDFEQQKQGIVPSCFLQDNGNLNDTAYELLVDYVFDELVNNNCIEKP